MALEEGLKHILISKSWNEEVLRCFGEERAFISVINRRQRVWLGHTPQNGDLIPSVIYEKRKIGMRPLGRPRMEMLDRVKDGDP